MATGIGLEMTGLWSGVMSGIWWAFGLIIILGVGWFLYTKLSYPIHIFVHQKRGNTYIVRTDKGRIINKNGVRILLSLPKTFKKETRISIPAPSYDDFRLFGNKPLVELVQSGLGQYAVISRNEFDSDLNTFKIKTTDPDVRFWEQQELRENKQKHSLKDTAEKWGAVIVMTGGFIIFTILMLIGMDAYTKQMEIASATVLSAQRNVGRIPVVDLTPPPTEPEPTPAPTLPFENQITGFG